MVVVFHIFIVSSASKIKSNRGIPCSRFVKEVNHHINLLICWIFYSMIFTPSFESSSLISQINKPQKHIAWVRPRFDQWQISVEHHQICLARPNLEFMLKCRWYSFLFVVIANCQMYGMFHVVLCNKLICIALVIDIWQGMDY